MITGVQFVGQLKRMGITHVVWVPDSTLGAWDAAISAEKSLRLIRVCREGEAWAVAHGLHMGGAKPLVLIQCTGLFDSGDSLRCALYDFGVPLFAAIGYRSYLIDGSTDSARTYTEPILKAWNIDYKLIDTDDKIGELSEHYLACQQSPRPGVALIAEGRM